MTRAFILFAQAISSFSVPSHPSPPLCAFRRFWPNSPQFRRCDPSGGILKEMPSLWGLAFGMQDYRVVLTRFVVLVLRIPFMPFVTALTRLWLFDMLVLTFLFFHRKMTRLWAGLTSQRLSSLSDLWPCFSPSSGVFGDVGILGYTSIPSTHCTWSLAKPSRFVTIMCRPLPPPPAPSTNVAPSAAALPRWRPPPTGSVKVNVDGAFLPSARLGAIGVLARDSSGAVLGGFARPVPALGPASAVEASALHAGLEYAIARGWASVLVESDAAVLINKLHRPTPEISLLGGLLAPSRDLLAASRGGLRVGFAPCSANSAAHTLASWACQYNDVICFTSVCPELRSRIVLDDLSSSF
ncbi:hypothetical protein GQ457_08G031660 [Hibiscus cannabinus]